MYSKNYYNQDLKPVLSRKTLQIAKLLGDKALEAQACYSLGNTYTLLRDYEKAIEYHMRHLQIAQELNDRVGEGRACWSLGNAHTALGNHEDAMQFANQHLKISKEVCVLAFLSLLVWRNKEFEIPFLTNKYFWRYMWLQIKEVNGMILSIYR